MKARVPRVSVGVPVYNGEKYLKNALTALVQQDFQDFELIISDNASTDSTQDICQAFAREDSRIRYYRNPVNIGLAANHNRTVELAQGHYFKWAAHDDDFPKRMLSRFVEVFDNAPPSVSVVYSSCEYIDEAGNVDGNDSDHVDSDDPRPHRRLSHLLRNIHMYNSLYGLIRTDMLRKTRLHGLFPLSDHVLFGELAMVGIIVEIPEPLLRIRRHPGRTFTANDSADALRKLFNPGHRPRPFQPSLWTKANIELVRGALALPLPLGDKILCTAVAAGKPQLEALRAFAGRQRRKLTGLSYAAPRQL